MSEIIIFDTSVLVDHLRTGRHEEKIQGITGLVRLSSIVLSELWRGSSRPEEQQFLRNLEKNHPILNPTTKNWIESGQLLAKIRSAKGFLPEKLRDLHFDVLIALTTRSHGGRLITSNQADFELIRSFRRFQLEIW